MLRGGALEYVTTHQETLPLKGIKPCYTLLQEHHKNGRLEQDSQLGTLDTLILATSSYALLVGLITFLGQDHSTFIVASFPGLPRFSSSVCVQFITWKRYYMYIERKPKN